MTSPGHLIRSARNALVYLFLSCVFILTTAAATETNSAKVHISGYGLLGDLQLKKTLKMLEQGGKKPEFLTANYIEDAALILLSRVNHDGFLKGKVAAEIVLDTGSRQNVEWTGAIRDPLPRAWHAKSVHFTIHKGPLFYYEKVSFTGLSHLTEKEARHFFVETDALIPFHKTKVFTPQQLRRAADNLEETLQRRGFEHATVTATNVVRNETTGAVKVEVLVTEGKKAFVRSIEKEVFYPDSKEAAEVSTLKTNAVYTRLWIQDYVQQVKKQFYSKGYADAKVQIIEKSRDDEGSSEGLHFTAKVTTGNPIYIGNILFQGQKDTKVSMMRRRVRLSEGDPLDPVAVEEGRYRLARLGIFDSVELDYNAIDEETRDILYRVREGKHIDFSLLFGYGSYDQVRGGFDLDQFNVFGRGHQSHLRVVQSLKSSSADYIYSMPELVGRDIDVFINATALRREEISFLREEFGGGFGGRHLFKPIATDVSARYNYQVLNAANPDTAITNGVQNADVGSVIFDLKHDLRDNPLVPHSGYKIFTTLELASQYLAGDVNFQRFESSASYHLPIGEGHWMHLGLSHGFVTTISTPQVDLPFNKRFFPGGENSVRGYQLGEAAPRNAQGKIVGAESYMLANLELEQALSRTWSIVGFVDTVGFAESLANYPFDEGLVSVGGGLRWKTLIGPARLEYGYNLRRRTGDPVGTLHFSVGFPF
jgi:outer membrane protein assembly complex protein YaeT